MALKKNLDVTIHEAFLEEILQGNWKPGQALNPVSYTHLRAHETRHARVCRLLLE